MGKKNIDYSDDSIFKSSKTLSKIALKNIQPPMIEVPYADDTVITQQPISVISNIPNNNSNKVYSELLRYFSYLNHNLDEALTDLDSRFNEVKYPDIDLTNKPNHNKNFDDLNAMNTNEKKRVLMPDIIKMLQDMKPIDDMKDKLFELSKIANNDDLNALEPLFTNYLINMHGSGMTKYDLLKIAKQFFFDETNEEIKQTIDDIIDGKIVARGIYHGGAEKKTTSKPISSLSKIDLVNLIKDKKEPNQKLKLKKLILNNIITVPDGKKKTKDIEKDNATVVELINYILKNKGDDTLIKPEIVLGKNEYKSVFHKDISADDIDRDDIENEDEYVDSLFTKELSTINSNISNLLIYFTSSVEPVFNSLNRRQVEKINEENEKIKPKIHELISDEFINHYHIPQTNTITKNFTELYTSINRSVKSYVQPRMNGAGLHGIHKPKIIQYKYYL
jgi:hypothetical protein